MRRTARRPLAAGRLEPSSALWFGILLSFAGGIYLAVAVNALASLLAVLTLVSYLALVHPAQTKNASMYGGRRSSRRHASTDRMGCGIGKVELRSMGTLRHAVPLAVSPLHGHCVDVSRGLCTGWILSSSSGRAKRALYVLAGPRGLTCSDSSQLDPNGDWRTPARVYFVAACILSSGFFYYSARLAFRRSNAAARRLLMASIIYLPLVFLLMVLDKL